MPLSIYKLFNLFFLSIGWQPEISGFVSYYYVVFSFIKYTQVIHNQNHERL